MPLEEASGSQGSGCGLGVRGLGFQGLESRVSSLGVCGGFGSGIGSKKDP